MPARRDRRRRTFRRYADLRLKWGAGGCRAVRWV